MDQHREFLLNDYEANARLLAVYVSMRLAVVGATLPVIGYLLSLRLPSELWLPRMSMLLLALAGSSAALRMFGAVNRNVYARCLHLAWIEQELGELGFYRYWAKFVQRCSRDSSSHAVVVASRSINIVTSAYVAWEGSAIARTIEGWLAVAVALAVVAWGVRNEFYIRGSLSETGFLDRLASDLETARCEARQEMQTK